MKENFLVGGFVIGGLFLIIYGAAFAHAEFIPVGIGLFTTVAGYLYGASNGEKKAMLKYKMKEK